MCRGKRFCYDNVNIKLSIFSAPFSKLAFKANYKLLLRQQKGKLDFFLYVCRVTFFAKFFTL